MSRRSWATVAAGGIQSSPESAERGQDHPVTPETGSQTIEEDGHRHNARPLSSGVHRSAPKAHAVSLPQKERDQLRLAELLARKEARAAQERALAEFQHDQMVKRWAAGKQDVKPNRALYLSDFIGGDTTTVVAAAPGTSATVTVARQAKVGEPTSSVDARLHVNPVLSNANSAIATLTRTHTAQPPVVNAADEDSGRSPQRLDESTGLKIHRNRRSGQAAVEAMESDGIRSEKPSSVTKPKGREVKTKVKTTTTTAAATPLCIASVPLAGTVVSGGAAGRRATRSESPMRGKRAAKPTATAAVSAGPKDTTKRVSAVKRLVWRERQRVFLQGKQNLQQEVVEDAAGGMPLDGEAEDGGDGGLGTDSSCSSSCSEIIKSASVEEHQAVSMVRRSGAIARERYSEAAALVEELSSLHGLVKDRRQQGDARGATALLRKLRRRKAQLMHMTLQDSGSGDAPCESDARDVKPRVEDSGGAVSVRCHGEGECAEDDDEETVALSKPLTTASAAMSRAFFFPLLTQHRNVGGWHPLQHRMDRRTSRTNSSSTTAKPAADAASDGAVSGSVVARAAVRDYCVNVLTDALDDAAWSFLLKLQVAQKKLKTQQPMHFRSRMRYVSGLKEVMRSLAAGRVRLVLVAPDVEPVAADPPAATEAVAEHHCAESRLLPGGTQNATNVPRRSVRALGLEGSVAAIVEQCAQRHVPWACCLSRKRLGYALRLGSSSVSAVAVLSAESAYEEYRTLVSQVREAFSEYQSLSTN